MCVQCLLVPHLCVCAVSVCLFAQYVGSFLVVFFVALAQLQVCLNIFIITLTLSVVFVLMLSMV